MINYEPDLAWVPDNAEESVGGFEMSRRSLSEYQEELENSVSSEWVEIEKLRPHNIVYLCKIEPLKKGYIQPVFPELDTVFVVCSKEEKSTSEPLTFASGDGSVVIQEISETETRLLNNADSQEDPVSGGYTGLTPPDRIIAQITDGFEGEFMAQSL